MDTLAWGALGGLIGYYFGWEGLLALIIGAIGIFWLVIYLINKWSNQ